MSRRIEQVNSYLQEELNTIFIRDFELPKDTLTTITKVDTSKDLTRAKIFLSILPVNQRGTILTKIKKASKHLRYLLSRRFSSHKVPQLEFIFDDSLLKQRQVEREIEKYNNK